MADTAGATLDLHPAPAQAARARVELTQSVPVGSCGMCMCHLTCTLVQRASTPQVVGTVQREGELAQGLPAGGEPGAGAPEAVLILGLPSFSLALGEGSSSVCAGEEAAVRGCLQSGNAHGGRRSAFRDRVSERILF